jgi:hypothetical protein
MWVLAMIKFHLDTLNDLKKTLVDGGKVDFTGWVIHKERKIDSIKIVQGGNTKTIDLSVRRPLLVKSNPTWFVGDAGFTCNVNIVKNVELKVFADVGGDSYECFSINSEEKKPVFFLHIAKTAGSSVNSFFENKISGKSYFHVESRLDWQLMKFSGEHFISGHLTYKEFKNKLNVDDYFKVVTLRSPVAHLISHLSWIRKIVDDAVRFDAHPEYIQNLSIKLKNTDMSNPSDLRRTISMFSVQELSLLDNTQTRYLRENAGAHPVVAEDISSAVKNLNEFDVVGCSENLDGFLSEISALKGWDFSGQSPQENRLSEKFGLDDSAEILEVLRPLIVHDIALYSAKF